MDTMTSARPRRFLLGVNLAGRWVIRDHDGRAAGVFRTREAAIRHARHAHPGSRCVIVPAPDGVMLDFPIALPDDGGAV